MAGHVPAIFVEKLIFDSLNEFWRLVSVMTA